MKAVLYRTLPPGSVVDLTHEVRPHAIREGAFLLRHMARGFPAPSVHVAVIDPGVGGRRAPIAVECRGGTALVGPDNGVLWPLATELGARRTVRLDPAALGRKGEVSATFEGRDLFAPAAAALASGREVRELGAAHRPLRLDLARPRRSRTGATGEVVHIDRFGNIITNLPARWLAPGSGELSLRLSRRPLRTLLRARTYEELPFGELGVLGSSFGLVEISQREGPAAERLGAEVGERVELRWPARADSPGGERKKALD